LANAVVFEQDAFQAAMDSLGACNFSKDERGAAARQASLAADHEAAVASRDAIAATYASAVTSTDAIAAELKAAQVLAEPINTFQENARTLIGVLQARAAATRRFAAALEASIRDVNIDQVRLSRKRACVVLHIHWRICDGGLALQMIKCYTEMVETETTMKDPDLLEPTIDAWTYLASLPSAPYSAPYSPTSPPPPIANQRERAPSTSGSAATSASGDALVR
jgi:hypothetical protein